MTRVSLIRIVMLVAVMTVLVSGGTVLVQRLTAHKRLYDYDVTASQSYPLAERAAHSVDVELAAGGFEWPDLPHEIDTLFLAVEIEATLRGRWADPFLEYHGRDVVARQHFARSARGKRYVDLTPMLRHDRPSAGDFVSMVGHGLRWQSGTTLLAGFQNPEVEGTTILVLSPHPDDAEIAAFGLYSHAKATVVTVTAGDFGTQLYKQLFPDIGEHDAVKGHLRVWDSITVPHIGGVPPERAWNLGYFDATLEAMYKNPKKAVQAMRSGMTDIDTFRAHNVTPLPGPAVVRPSWTDLVVDLKAVLAEVEPKIIVAPNPFVDAHSDHRFTTIALCEALKGASTRDATFFLYMNYGIYSRNLPHGPRTSLRALPPWFDEPFPFASIYSHVLSERESGLKGIALETMRDLREFDMRPQLSITTRLRDLKKAVWEEVTSAQKRTADYYRYEARPNEIFFALASNEFPALCEAFLTRWRKGEFGHFQ